MEVLLKITALCLLAAVVAALLRRSEEGLALVLMLAAAVCAAALLAAAAGELSALSGELIALTGLAPAVFVPLGKVLAIVLTVRLGCAFCRDAAQETLCILLETAGAVCALLAAAPLLRAVIELVGGFL